MKKIIFLMILGLWLWGCSGNPPRWWNPSGTYGVEGTVPSSKSSDRPVHTSLPTQPTPEEEDTFTMEQTFAPTADSFEEFSLSPYPQPDTAEALPTSSSLESAKDEAEELNISAAQSLVSSAQEYLPADGSLPPPSVLE